MTLDMYLQYFTENEDFPFFIQYGHHNEEMFEHNHKDFSELVIILEGNATHIINGEIYPIKKGDVFVINSNVPHGYKDPHHFHICNIMFHPSHFIPEQNDIKSLPGYHALFVIEPILIQQEGFQGQLTLSPEAFEEIHQKLVEIHREYTTHSTGYQTMITGLFLQMITKLSRLYNTQETSPKHNSLSLAASVAYIENHLEEELSIESLASIANVSPRHFRRIFHSIYGTSPVKYINTLRLQTARRLLASTDLPVTEIALRCGFCDGNYFSSKFKEATGMNPSSYRKLRE